MWQLPGRLLAAVLLVEAIAFVALVIGLVGCPVLPPAELRLAAAGCLLALAHTEVAVRVERRRGTEAHHVDLSSVWTFAGALVLPGPYAALLAGIVTFHLWARAGRHHVPLHHAVFGVATAVVACVVTAGVVDYADPGAGPADHDLWVLVVAVLAYATVTMCCAAAVAAGLPGASLPAAVVARDEYVLEIGALCLGALIAVASGVNPWLVLFVLPTLLVLLRTVLLRPLEAAASMDGKTGLLNAATWHARAVQMLRGPHGAERPCGLLLLDLDRFKAVNDTYGHIVGDRVLAAVAEVLRGEVRTRDLVGRFGGEEFVVMLLTRLGGAGSVELEVVAERIRLRVAALRVDVSTAAGTLVIGGLSISVGAAVVPIGGTDVAILLQTADRALYAAKRAGRNTVQMRLASPAPQPA